MQEVETIEAMRLESHERTSREGVKSSQCHICGKTYSRVDHLERHLRSHSTLKPFSCGVCNRHFARGDVLKRHLTTHNHDEQPPTRSSYTTRSRVSRACVSCATAKLKCDNGKPCARCRSKKVPCVFTPPVLNDCHSSKSSTDCNPYPDWTVSPQSRSHEPETDPSVVEIPNALHQEEASSYQICTRSSACFAPREQAMSEAATEPTVNTNAIGSGIYPLSSDISDMLDESSLADFLNSIMLPSTSAPAGHLASEKHIDLQRIQRDFLDFGTPWDVSMDPNPNAMPCANEIEWRLFNSGQKRNNNTNEQLLVLGARTPIFANGFGLKEAAFARSIWGWTPTQDDHRRAEQLNLALSHADVQSSGTSAAADSPLTRHYIDQKLRDNILALVLSTCNTAVFGDVVSAFPSAELLTAQMSHFLVTHSAQTDSYLHIPTLWLDEQCVELITMTIAAGAMTSSVPAMRKFGDALQETAREALARKIESDNRCTRDLQCLQSLAIQLQAGYWSGNRRKMEIAEALAQPLITMMRKGGRFRRPRSTSSAPSLDDSEDILNSKWRHWVFDESYKRLACHLLIHDTQSSIAQQVAPLLSPLEFSLEFPAARELWTAGTAQEWKAIYLQLGIAASAEPLTVAQSITCLAQIREQPHLDVALSGSIAIHCLWALVWNQSQLQSLLQIRQSSQAAPPDLTSGSFEHPRVPQLLEEVRMIFSDWDGLYLPEISLVLERILLNQHVPFEQVQLFAGKDGEEEARRAFPVLHQWASTSDARKAVWHAGQVLKAAGQCPHGKIHDFQAVCLYHAALTFWAYAVVAACNSESQDGQPRVPCSNNNSDSVHVWLDGQDCSAVRRFIVLNRGCPVVGSSGETSTSRASPVSLGDPHAILTVCIDVLRRNNVNGTEDPLPLVENLSQMMRDLRNAARGVLHGRHRERV
ncbi:hypothetical protein GE09DRAFT_742958 [Coniochaeta sp. 2T2.1]|nr:hypothetical protein GE09DRAFT_742958 [Coniochaeta sp. 2T2.1]